MELDIKQRAFVLLLFQFCNLAISFFTTFYIASQLSSSLYAVVAVSYILSSLTLSFSMTGLDSYIKRNLLFWRKTGKVRYAKLMTTNAMFYRWAIALLLQAPLFIYSLYISESKFEGSYVFFFVSFSALSSLTALCATMTFILQADNRYILASFYTFVTTLVSKLLVLLIFIKYGFGYYLFSLTIAPVVLFFLQFRTIYGNFDHKLIIAPASFVRLVKKRKYLLFSSYSTFMFRYLDNFLISLMLPAYILGSYTLMKQILAVTTEAVDNIMEPVMIKFVALKNDIIGLKENYKRVKKVRNFLIICGITVFFIFVFSGHQILDIVNLSHHINIYNYVLLAIIAKIVDLLMTIPFYAHSVLDSEFAAFKIYLITSVTNLIASIVTFSLLPYEFAACNLILLNLLLLCYLHYNKKNSLWSVMCK